MNILKNSYLEEGLSKNSKFSFASQPDSALDVSKGSGRNSKT